MSDDELADYEINTNHNNEVDSLDQLAEISRKEQCNKSKRSQTAYIAH